MTNIAICMTLMGYWVFLFLFGEKMNLSEIFTFENLFMAHELCRRGKQHKRGTIMFELDNARNITQLADALANKKYKIGKYRIFKIYDPKERQIKALPYKDRVVQMCFCRNVLEPCLERRLIHDNAASRVGRGTDFAINRMHSFMRKLFINTGGNDAYFLKCDIAKYFASINHEILISQLQRCGFSADEMWYMKMVISSSDDIAGLPLGNQTSQWFALLYLNDLDHFIKEKLRVGYYVRYMDDFILLHRDKEFLKECRAAIERFCNEKLQLKLNAKTQIGRIRDGVDFLGFNHRLTSTGRIIKTIRASARRRQRRYLKTISRCYLDDIVDDKYLSVRQASFVGHMRGAIGKKFVINALNTMRRMKRITGGGVNCLKHGQK